MSRFSQETVRASTAYALGPALEIRIGLVCNCTLLQTCPVGDGARSELGGRKPPDEGTILSE